LREQIVELRPTPEKVVYHILLQYQAPRFVFGSLEVPVSQLFPEREEEFVEQFKAEKGSLYEEWLEKSKELIKEGFERRKAVKPRVIRV